MVSEVSHTQEYLNTLCYTSTHPIHTLPWNLSTVTSHTPKYSSEFRSSRINTNCPCWPEQQLSVVCEGKVKLIGQYAENCSRNPISPWQLISTTLSPVTPVYVSHGLYSAVFPSLTVTRNTVKVWSFPLARLTTTDPTLGCWGRDTCNSVMVMVKYQIIRIFLPSPLPLLILIMIDTSYCWAGPSSGYFSGRWT